MNLSPALRLSFGVASMLACALVVSDMFFGIFTDPNDGLRVQRAMLADVTTAYVVQQLPANDHRSIEQGLDAVRERSPDIVAVVVRTHEGDLVASSGAAPLVKPPEAIVIPIESNQGEWGHVEFYFKQLPHDTVTGWLAERRLWLTVGLSAGFVLMTYLYLRRALLYLDPMSVVPDRLRTAFDSLTEAVALLDPKHRVVLGNKALREMSSLADNKLLGRKLEDAARLEVDGDGKAAPWQTVIATGQPVRGVRVHVGSGENRKTGSMNCAPIVDGFGKVRGCLVTVADVTAIEHSNDQLRSAMAEIELARQRIEVQNQELTRLAMYDGLTSLMNRRAFFENANAVVARQTSAGGAVAVLMLDVDHFKSFNDRFGHATGDVVLQRVARSLADTVRFNDLAARYGGEEFCVLVEDLETQAVLALAERIRKAIETDAGITTAEGQALTVTVSIGVAISAPASTDLSEMVKSADAALYESKRGGRNRVTLAGQQASPMTRKLDVKAREASAASDKHPA